MARKRIKTLAADWGHSVEELLAASTRLKPGHGHTESSLLSPEEADRLKADKSALNEVAGVIPRILLIETEYDEAMRVAEINWLRKTIAEIQGGGYPWPVMTDGQLAWDGDETFQVPDMPLEAWAESAKTKESAKAKEGERKARK